VKLKSEHAARIIDVGRLDTGSPYIVMEYLEGQDLAQVLEQQRALPVGTACDYIIQACDAIAEAHSLGIVHRDLKPGNLFLARTSHGQQVIKVLDFGISKTQGPAGDVNMTRTQVVMGSPGYMSPEQMRSTKNVDGRTDVWSLGVILYELVAGRTPFQADTFSGLCVKIAMDPHPPMRALPATLPPGFEAVVNRALEKDPARRHQSAAELAQALAPYAGAAARDRAQRLVAAVPGALPSAAHQVMLGPNANTLDAASGQARSAARGRSGRSRAQVIAGAGIAAAVAIGVGIGVTRGGGGAAVEPGAAPHHAPPTAHPDLVEPRVPVDAGVASPGSAAPAADTGAPGPALPAGAIAPVAPARSDAPARPDAGVAAPMAPAPSPPAPSKPRSRPATVDPYSSPD
jgi:serine/threonine-protein kinase